MGFTVETPKSLLEEYTRELEGDYTKALSAAASDFIADMLERTGKGKDVNGRDFTEYQGGYAKQIKETGKVEIGRGQYRSKALNPVNLHVTGKMLDSITYKVSKKGKQVVISVPASQAAKARGIQEGNKFIKHKREFFAISEEEKEKFVETLKQNLRLFKDE